MFLNKQIDSGGSAVIETAITFPVIAYIIFFVIETLIIKELQVAIDNIAEECATQFMFSKDTTFSNVVDPEQLINFNGIIKRHLPVYVSRSDITYYFTMFDSPKDMYDNIEYNIPIYWPASNNSNIPESGESLKTTGTKDPSNTVSLVNYTRPELNATSTTEGKQISLTQKAFVLTVVVRYKFSSSFVKMLFAGGANTSGSNYLIWSRSAGFCR